MITPPFHENMRRARLVKDLTQQQAGQACDITRSRWAQIESDSRPPTDTEKESIRSFLAIPNGPTRPPGVLERFSNNGRRLRGALPPFMAAQDRPNYVRYNAASRRFPFQIRALTARVEMRDDYGDCVYFASKIASGSYAEAIHLLRLLADGAVPCVLPPDNLGRTPKPIVDPDSRREVGTMPFFCLAHNESFTFFQVSFATPQVHTVDALVWNGSWTVVEIDGEGHDYKDDKKREWAIGLPFTRYQPTDLFLDLAS